ncbi:hypothetical protein GCM10023188_07490 [Pontibacter saemangeumensis]|uniref:Uncharacterized protein n=1 Tax=Pontibacter saemangeumensis TaxID=1084525 RepID=A0ABP8LBM5_9BACT
MNQFPEQVARDLIDKLMTASEWVVHVKKVFKLTAAVGVAIYFSLADK